MTNSYCTRVFGRLQGLLDLGQGCGKVAFLGETRPLPQAVLYGRPPQYCLR